MQRPIKFRGWDTRTKSWYASVNSPMGWNNENWKGSHEQCFTALTLPNEIVLQQFTGLLDKNGKEIYEGDVVLLPDTESEHIDVGIGGQGVKVSEQEIGVIGKVEYDITYACFKVIPVESGDVFKESCRYSFESIEDNTEGKVEVIGDIYSTPELIK